MNFISLFSGIGGIDRGLEDAGFECIAQCERDPFCLAVLEKHWPHVERFTDVRFFPTHGWLRPVDLVAGGFPCQPVSLAGKGKAQRDERWLWPAMLRIIVELRPAWVLIENVPGLKNRGADIVLGDLEAAVYAATAVVVGAWAIGAPHRRDRVWIVAKLGDSRIAAGQRNPGRFSSPEAGIGGAWSLNGRLPLRSEYASSGREVGILADAPLGGLGADRRASGDSRHADGGGKALGDSEFTGLERLRPDARQSSLAQSGDTGLRWPARPGQPQYDWEEPRLADAADWAARWGEQQPQGGGEAGDRERGDDAMPQLAVGGAASRLSSRLGRFANKHALKAYGNAVVPQIPELIGRWILASPGERGRQ